MNFFPNPYPGEILYSVIARYHQLSANSRVEQTMIEIYGVKSALAVTLPSLAQCLIKKIPWKDNYDEQSFINKNTLLTYYLPFLPESNKQQVKAIMSNNNQNYIHIFLGDLTKTLRRSTHLKYCARCVEEDLKKFGEAYWHRIHQVQGCFYCLKHNRILSSGCEECGFHFTPKKNKLHGLKEFCPCCGSDLTFQNQGWCPLISKYRTELMEICSDVHDLLENHTVWEKWAFKDWHTHYVNKLIASKFCSEQNKVRYKKIKYFFQRFYGKAFLELVNCNLDVSSWLKECIKCDHAIHPLKHILLIRFLFGSLKDFREQSNFNNDNEYSKVPILDIGVNKKNVMNIETKLTDKAA